MQGTTLTPRLGRRASQSPRQRGVALFVVIVFVMLSMLLALWSSRTALFGELLVGNDADYQRAYEAAQALLQDAELDIRGENADGTECTPRTTGADADLICRRRTALDHIPLTDSGKDNNVRQMLAALDDLKVNGKPVKCRNGLCAKRDGKQDFWNNTNVEDGLTLAQMTGNQPAQGGIAISPVGARYGMFTGATLGDTDNPANPILQWTKTTPANQGGWYWIEVLRYDGGAKNSGLIVGTAASPAQNYLALHLAPNVVYRITALANGRKTRPARTGETGDQPLTTVVLQQTYARQKKLD